MEGIKLLCVHGDMVGGVKQTPYFDSHFPGKPGLAISPQFFFTCPWRDLWLGVFMDQKSFLPRSKKCSRAKGKSRWNGRNSGMYMASFVVASLYMSTLYLSGMCWWCCKNVRHCVVLLQIMKQYSSTAMIYQSRMHHRSWPR